MLKDWGMLGVGWGGEGDGLASFQSSQLSFPDNIAQGDTSISPQPPPPHPHSGFLPGKQFAKVSGLLNFNKVSKMIRRQIAQEEEEEAGDNPRTSIG